MTVLGRIEGWPARRSAAGWVGGDGRSERFGATSERFALASVTKPLFAYAVLVAIEEGTLALDQPAGPDGATVAHLLAHASGLGDDPSEPIGPVESRRIYSNGAYEVLGQLLADASGMAASEYFHEAVVIPLGLSATELDGSPAHGATSSVDDLLTVAGEWLSPTLISPATITEATTPQFADLPGVLPGYGRHDPNPWGLGFEIRGHKQPHWTGANNSPRTYGHFGRAGTFIWVDPEPAVACVALTDHEFGPWAIEVWPELAEAVLVEATAGP